MTLSAFSLTCSPISSYQNSVLSPTQTEFTELAAVGMPRSRIPSPLRNMNIANMPVDVDAEYVCPRKNCASEFSSKKDLGLHFRVGHSHICLWGNNGPCDSAGFATREELNWHVKREHLLLCPVPGCTEGTFLNKEFLDYHLKLIHSIATTNRDTSIQPIDILGATTNAPEQSSASCQVQTSATTPKPIEDRALKIEMSIGTSKKRCREQLKTVLEKRIKRVNGGTPKAGESSAAVGNRASKLLESATFPILWEHSILPFLIDLMPKWCGPGHVISVMRGRKPNARRVCIMTKQPISRPRKLVIAWHVLDLFPEAYRNSITFVFSVGKVDRLVWSRGLSKEMPDEICLPRNPFCYISPCMGDSIGTTAEDGDEITATLGPCVTINGASFWLVNFHPFVDASKGGIQPVSIEQPSPADRASCIDERHDILTNGDFNFRVGNLTATSGFDLKTTRISHDPYWEECGMEPPLVVTDWALVSAKGHQANMLRRFPTPLQKRETPVTSMSTVVPGASVCSTGRSSGFQRGEVCEVPAYLDGFENGTGRASREWYIEEPYPYDNDNEWISGGIGVEGDSGAAIIDYETNSIVGQLWGRNKYYGPGPRYTYFTPIFDIFDDIQERCGQERRPQLPQYRNEEDMWSVYPVCRQCFDIRESQSRRSSRESLLSIRMHEGRAGDIDNDLTSVSELATPKDQSHLIRHVGPDVASPSFGGVVSPAPIYSLYTVTHAPSPGNSELRSPYAQALNEEDLYEKCPSTNEVALGKRPILPTPMARSGSQQRAKRRRVM
ncbi:uncharacterized protein GGS22DRAFT_179000 [Annulohypoxylon maeteangense]|uniref:uncharacterized protein n=1 Tax=Annulohypoxylon maeteangense TaxID=1927788 RepID=UPI00200761DB|nr:uncharacterized protein GGS22DRAFT_179000 [Annulohypoxylon maeteangense]KAI0887066.1 hypothetical protein GGS22DRAFT_179000 [Annulohypoxylon maeteangense]